MKIIELQISKLRGIVDLKLKLDGHNTVIWGPNGVGKSAVVDAIDFLLSGNITRLSGDNTKELSIGKHGPHVSYKPSEAKVTASIKSQSGKVFSVTRTVANKNEVKIDPAFIDEFNELSAYASNGAHFLSRRELLRYILVTPKSRSDQIQTLLDISDLKETRDTFVKVNNKLKSELKSEKNRLDTCKETLKRLLGLPSHEEVLLLEAINRQRSMLDGDPLTDLSCDDFISGISYSAEPKEEIAIFIKQAEDFLNGYPDVVSSIISLKRDLMKTLQDLMASESTSINKNSVALIKSGLKILDDTGQCPLCLYQWPSGVELREFLLDRERQGEALSKLIDSFYEGRNKILTVIKAFNSKATTVGNSIAKYSKPCSEYILSAFFSDENCNVISSATIERNESMMVVLDKLISEFSTEHHAAQQKSS